MSSFEEYDRLRGKGLKDIRTYLLPKACGPSGRNKTLAVYRESRHRAI
jgi:hypothetical protein